MTQRLFRAFRAFRSFLPRGNRPQNPGNRLPITVYRSPFLVHRPLSPLLAAVMCLFVVLFASEAAAVASFPQDARWSKALKEARAWRDAGRHRDAADCYFSLLRALPDGPGVMVPHGKGRHVALTLAVLKDLRGLSADARRHFRVAVRSVTRPLLRRGHAARDRSALMLLIRRYLASAEGAEGARLLAAWAFEEGNALEAARFYTLARDACSDEAQRDRLALRIVVAFARARLPDRARRELTTFRRASTPFAAGSGPADRAVIAEALSRVIDRTEKDLAFRGETRPWARRRGRGTVPFLAVDGHVTSIFIGPTLPLSAIVPFGGPPPSPVWAACTERGRVYWKNESGVACFSPLMGEVIWKKLLPHTAPVPHLVLDAANLYVPLQRSHSRGDRVLEITGLAALDRETGVLKWSAMAPDPAESGGVVGPPLTIGGRLYTVSCRGTGVWNYELVVLDPDTGDPVAPTLPLHSRPLASVAEDDRAFPALVQAGAFLVIATGGGVIAGVDLGYGALSWALSYPRVRTRRVATPAVLLGKTVAVLPADAAEVMVLRPKTGEVLRRLATGRFDCFLGLFKGRLIFTDGKALRTWDPVTGETTLVEPDIAEARLAGARVTDAGIWVPARKGILLLVPPFWTPGPCRELRGLDLDRSMERVLVGPDAVYLAFSELLIPFVRSEEAEARLRALALADPADPRPHLSLGILHLSRERLRPALDAFTEGLAGASGVHFKEEDRLKGLMSKLLKRLWKADPARAEVYLRRALSMGPDPGDAYEASRELSRLLEVENRWSAALAVWEDFANLKRQSLVPLGDAMGEVAACRLAQVEVQRILARVSAGEREKFERRAAARLRAQADSRAVEGGFPLSHGLEAATLFRCAFPGTAAASRVGLALAESFHRVQGWRRALLGADAGLSQPDLRRVDCAAILALAADCAARLGEKARAARYLMRLDREFGDVRLGVFTSMADRARQAVGDLPRPKPKPSVFTLPLRGVWRRKLSVRDRKYILTPEGDVPAGYENRLYLFSEIVIPRSDDSTQEEEGEAPEQRRSSYRIDCIDVRTGELLYPCPSFDRMKSKRVPGLAWSGTDLVIWDGRHLSRVDNHTGKRVWYRFFSDEDDAEDLEEGEDEGEEEDEDEAPHWVLRADAKAAVILTRDCVAAFDAVTGGALWKLVPNRKAREKKRGKGTAPLSFESVSLSGPCTILALGSGRIQVIRTLTGEKLYELDAGPFSGRTFYRYAMWNLDRSDGRLVRQDMQTELYFPSHCVGRGTVDVLFRRYGVDSLRTFDLLTGRLQSEESFPRAGISHGIFEHYYVKPIPRVFRIGERRVVFQHPRTIRLETGKGTWRSITFPDDSEVGDLHDAGKDLLVEFSNVALVGGLTWTRKDIFETLGVFRLRDCVLLTSNPMFKERYPPLIYLIRLADGSLLRRWLPSRPGLIAASAIDGVMVLIYNDGLEAYVPGDTPAAEARLASLGPGPTPAVLFERAGLLDNLGRSREAFGSLAAGLTAQGRQGRPLNLAGIRRVKTFLRLQKEVFKPYDVPCPILPGHPAQDTEGLDTVRFRMKGAITPDGDDTDWDGVPSIQLAPSPKNLGLSTRVRYYRPPGAAGMPVVRYRVAASGGELHFLVEVEDEDHQDPVYVRKRLFDGDRVVLFVDGNKIALALKGGRTVYEAYQRSRRYFRLRAAVTRRGTRTLYEVSLPMVEFVRARPLPMKAPYTARVFPRLPGPGDGVNFGIVVYDQNKEGRWAALCNCPGAFEDYDEAVVVDQKQKYFRPDHRFMARLRFTDP